MVQSMRWNYSVFLLFLLTLGACSPLSDRVDDRIMSCGDSRAAADETLIQFIPDLAIEALLVGSERYERPRMSPKGCLIIGPAERQNFDRVVVRDSASKTLGQSVALKPLNPGLVSIDLKTTGMALKPVMHASCPLKEMAANNKLPLLITSSDVSRASLPLIETKFFDSEKNLRFHLLQDLESNPFSLDFAVPEGTYQVEINSFDAFSPVDSSIIQRCTLIVDQSRPTLALAWDRAELYREGTAIHKAEPGQRLRIQGAEEGEIRLCAKMRKDEDVQIPVCTAEEFMPHGSEFTVPNEGIWDVYMYAKDRAGNLSPIEHSALAVYHEDVIKLLLSLGKQLRSLKNNGAQFEAFQALKEIVQMAKQLKLKEELRSIYWQILGNYLDLSKMSLIWRQQIGPEETGLNGGESSPNADIFSLASSHGLAIIEGRKTTFIPGNYQDADYITGKDMVALRYKEDAYHLDFYRGTKLIDTRELDGTQPTVYSDFESHFVFLLYRNKLEILTVDHLHESRQIDFASVPGLGVVDGNREKVNLSVAKSGRGFVLWTEKKLARYDYRTLKPQVYELPGPCYLGSVETRDLEEIYLNTLPLDKNAPAGCGLKQILWSGEKPSIRYFPDEETGAQGFKQIILSAKGPTASLAACDEGVYGIHVFALPGSTPHETNYIPLRLGNISIAKDAWMAFDPVHPDFLYLQNGKEYWRLDLSRTHLSKVIYKKTFVSSFELPTFFPAADPSTAIVYHLFKRTVEVHRFDDSTWSMLPSPRRLRENIRTDKTHGLIVSREQNTFLLHQVESGLQRSYTSPVEIQEYLSISPDELAIVGTDRSLRIWNALHDTVQDLPALTFDVGKLVYYDRSQTLVASSLDASEAKTHEVSKLFRRQGQDWIATKDNLPGAPAEWLESPNPILLRMEQGNVFIDIIAADFSLAKSFLARPKPADAEAQEGDAAPDYYKSLFGEGHVYPGEHILYYLTSHAVRKFDLQTHTDTFVYRLIEGQTLNGILDSPRAFCFYTQETLWDRLCIMRPLDGGPMQTLERSSRDLPFFPHGAKDLDKGGFKDRYGVEYSFSTDQLLPKGKDQMEVVHVEDNFNRGFYQVSEYKIDPEWFDRLLEKWPLYAGEKAD